MCFSECTLYSSLAPAWFVVFLQTHIDPPHQDCDFFQTHMNSGSNLDSCVFVQLIIINNSWCNDDKRETTRKSRPGEEGGSRVSGLSWRASSSSSYTASSPTPDMISFTCHPPPPSPSTHVPNFLEAKMFTSSSSPTSPSSSSPPGLQLSQTMQQSDLEPGWCGFRSPGELT